ncbi:MAG: PH domain-containing protein [Clostridiales bacterium]|nr:PH domain-containing protein [Clostridiales bacterium]
MVAQPTRAHPSYIVIAALRSLKESYELAVPLAFLGLLLLRKYFAVSVWKTILGALLLFGIPLGGLALIGFAHWWTHTFWIAHGALQVQYGILRRTTQHIPLRRIQAVSFEADLLERLFRVVRLRIFLAESSGLEGGEILIRALPREEAEMWAREILPASFASSSPAADPASVSPKGETLVDAGDPKGDGASQKGILSGELRGDAHGKAHRYSTSEAFVTALTSAPLLQTFLLLALIYYGELASFRDDALAELVARGILAAPPDPLALELIQLILLFFLSWIVAFIGKWIYTLRYRFFRTPEAIILEEGWISRRTKVITIERIQALEIRQNLLQLFFGFASFRIHVAGKGDVSTGTIPFLRTSHLNTLLQDLLPEFPDILADLKPLPAGARSRYWVRFSRYIVLLILFLFGLAAILYLFFHFRLAVYLFDELSRLLTVSPVSGRGILLSFLLLLLSVGMAWGELSYRFSGYRRTSQGYVMASFVFSRYRTFVPRNRVQQIHLFQNPFQRPAGLATVRLHWVGGSEKLFHLPLDDVLSWRRP